MEIDFRSLAPRLVLRSSKARGIQSAENGYWRVASDVWVIILLVGLLLPPPAPAATPTPSGQKKDAQSKIEKLVEQKRHKEALDTIDALIQADRQSASMRLGNAELIPKIKESADVYLRELIKANPSDPTYRKRLATVLFDLGRQEEALSEWRKLAEARPPDPEAMHQLAWAYVSLKRTSEAEKLASALTKMDPENVGFLKLSANIALEKRQYSKAAELAQKASAREPGNKEISFVLAKAMMRQGRQKAAMEILDRLQLANPENMSIRYEIADVLITTGRAEDALPILNILVKSDPSNSVYRKRRAQVLYDMGRIEEATAERRLLAIETPTNTDVQMQLAWGYMTDKKFDEAFKIAEHLLRIDPRNGKFLKFMASVELERKNFEEAVKWAHAAMSVLPADRDTSLILARSLLALRRESAAMNILEELVKTGNENPAVWSQMTSLLGHLGRYKEALVYANKLYEQDRTNFAWRRQRADVLYQLGRFDEAAAEWRDMARQKPPDVVSMRRMADDAFYRQDWKEFLGWIDQLAELQVLEPFQWSRITSAHQGLKNYSQALAAADRYIESAPTTLETYLAKAEILEAIPDWSAAKRIYEYVLTKNPNNRRAWDALARIAAETGDLREALRIQRIIRNRYLAAYPYPDLREASWLAESGQSETAMQILREHTRQRQPAIAALLYHSISTIDRTDSLTISQETFRSQMKAIKKAGFTPITVTELEPFYTKGKPLPPKPILITFDDARIDSLRNADPVLEELGMKATMFVHVSALEKFPYHAGPEELQRWVDTGRWEVQSHSSRGHDLIQVDPAGRLGRFYTNRKWLPEEARLESMEEYKARIAQDFLEAKDLLKKSFPTARIIALAFPEGEYGQLGSVNVPEAMDINRELVKKEFDFCFIQGPYGYNLAKSKTTELTRFEVPTGMTAEQLVSHLNEQEPWVQAKMTEANVWLARRKPMRALRIVRRLEREGIRGPELTAQKGIIMDGLGRAQEAQRLYRLASEKAPTRPRYSQLVTRSSKKNSPSVNTEYGTLSDNFRRENSRATLRGGVPAGPFQISGSVSRETYSEPFVPYLTGRSGGLELRWVPASFANLQVAYARRQIQGERQQDFDLYGGKLTISPLAQFRLAFAQDYATIASAQAIIADIREDTRTGSVEWDSAFNTTISLSQRLTNYSDNNSRQDTRFELTHNLTPWLGAGYSFWYADAAELRTAYWTPQKLKQHMGFMALQQIVGPVTGKLQYGRGYGYEGSNARSVQSFLVGLNWDLSEHWSLIYSTAYSRSPVYISTLVNFGITLRY